MAEVPVEINSQWSNADIEFPSTSTSDEIEILSPPDDALCAELSHLNFSEDTASSANDETFEKGVDTSLTMIETLELAGRYFPWLHCC